MMLKNAFTDAALAGVVRARTDADDPHAHLKERAAKVLRNAVIGAAAGGALSYLGTPAVLNSKIRGVVPPRIEQLLRPITSRGVSHINKTILPYAIGHGAAVGGLTGLFG